MNKVLSCEIKKFLENQPLLHFNNDEDMVTIFGEYIYSLEFDGYIVQGKKKVKFEIGKDFPNSIPKFYVFDYPSNIEHIYEDRSVCLATIGEMVYFLYNNPSLQAFINKFIDSFIFTLDWFEKYNTYPFGERKHGFQGLLDYYRNDLKLTDTQYKKMVSIIYNKKYRGHSLCFCGSGKRLRDCHGCYIIPFLNNDSYKELFLKESYHILSEDGKYG